MIQSKQDLSAILHQVEGVVIGEGEQFLDDAKAYPKIAYWEYVWDDSMASGDGYETVVTYQVSFCSRRPRDPHLIALKQLLNRHDEYPVIYHEYVVGQNKAPEWHSYFTLDVLEEIG